MRIDHRWGRADDFISYRKLAGASASLLEFICNKLLRANIAFGTTAACSLFTMIGLPVSGWNSHRLGLSSVGMLDETVRDYDFPPIKVDLKTDARKVLSCISTVSLRASLGLSGPSQWLGARVAIYLQHYLEHLKLFRGISHRHAIFIRAATVVFPVSIASFASHAIRPIIPFCRLRPMYCRIRKP